MEQEQQIQTLSPLLTVLSLVNGMIGGFILILPVFALQAGYLSTMFVIIITGIFSYYSSYLCVAHMGNESDLDIVIFKHFGNSVKMKNIYDLCVWSSLLLIDLLYFQLIIIQWIGLAPPHQFTIVNAVLNGLALFCIAMAMKYFQFGANLMAYGIISIASYLIFLTWVVASEQTTSKDTQYKAIGSGIGQLAAGMGQAFAIQAFFIPILKKTQNVKASKKYIIISYIIGGIAYIYIAFMGSYGILYRDYLGYSDGQKTIEGYFGVGTWQVNIIQVIYLLHLYSVFPEFLLISKKRLFGVLGYPNTGKRTFNTQQIVYISLSVGICLLITMLRISIRDIIDLNGAVIGCFFIYFIPAALHIKCLYFSKDKGLLKTPIQNQLVVQNIKYQVMVEQQQKQDQANIQQNMNKIEMNSDSPSKKIQEANPTQIKQVYEQKQSFECNCNLENYSKKQKIINIIMIAVMVMLGIFIMIDGIRTLIID